MYAPGRLRVDARAALLLVFALAASCAPRGLALGEGRYENRAAGFSIDDPARRDDGAWQRVTIEGAVLAFRSRADAPQPGTMSMLRRCDGVKTAPRVRARQLLIGLEDVVFQADEAIVVDGSPGWRQVLRAGSEGPLVFLRTVSRVGTRCSTDWVLVSAEEDPALSAGFERWWASYRELHPGPAQVPPAAGDVP